MADAKTNYAENLVVKFLLTTDTAARPTTWFLAIHTSNPGEDAANGELSGDGYARQSVSFGVTGSVGSNTNLVTFGPATDNWGTITHFSLWDSVTGGNPLYYGPLDTSRTIETDDSLVVAIGALDIEEL
jgi:hypothetical protein